MQVIDQLNRTITLPKPPNRIVSLVPSLTELLCDLGLEEKLVGVTKFCVHPENIRQQKKVVGGTKTVKINKVIQLKPDFILANKEENTPKTVELLEKEFPVFVCDIKSVSNLDSLISSLGNIFSIEQTATILSNDINKAQSDFLNFIEPQDNLVVAYFIWKNPWMVVGGDTYINYLLKLNGFKNAFNNEDRYPQIKLEDIKDKQIDVIFLSSEPYRFSNKHVEEFQEFFKETKIVLVDGEMFSWYGSRILKAFKYFKELQKELK